jgi:CRP-like cAMP-binding protein
MAKKPDANRRKFQRNDVILKEGSVSEHCYLILKGKVSVVKGMHGQTPRTVATLGKGNVFGEMALFDGHPHIATVVAIDDTEVYTMSRDEFQRMVDRMDPVMKGMVAMLVSRLRQTVDELVPKAADINWADWKK